MVTNNSKFILLILFIQAYSFISFSQEVKQFISLESGINFQNCESKQYSFIRGSVDVSTYGINDNSNSLNLEYRKWYVGAKYERIIKASKASLIAGLRYSNSQSTLSKIKNYSDNSSFFYFLNKQEGTTTEYLKIKSIIRNVNYIGVPIELKLSLFGNNIVDFYIKAGSEFSYLIDYKTNVNFYNYDMEIYESDVDEKFSEPNKLLVMLYGSGGIRFGNYEKLSISGEIVAPSFFITKNVSGLVSPDTGAGIQINIHYPF